MLCCCPSTYFPSNLSGKSLFPRGDLSGKSLFPRGDLCQLRIGVKFTNKICGDIVSCNYIYL